MSLGERIKLARDRAGYSLRRLAEKAGVSHTAIANYEKDADVPSSGVLLDLAEALGVGLDSFFRAGAVTLEGVRFRRRARCTKRELRQAEGEVLDYVERYLQVEAIMGDPLPFLKPDIDWQVADLDDIERLAVELRDAWDLGLDPIDDLVSALEDRGVRVCLVEGCQGFDGLCAWLQGAMPVIAVRRGIPGDRQRFNLAHELAHLLLEPPPDMDEERAAHRFAGAFLVPQPAARSELGQRRHDLDVRELHLLKHKYGLSMQAWVFRARDLGVIGQETCERIFRRFSRSGWRRNEPGDPVPSDEPQRMRQLVYRALAEDKISRSRAIELLGAEMEALELAVA